LTFDVGGHRYRATRLVRVRNGKASTPEALLEKIDTDGTSVLLAERAKEMRPAVEELLGLPFDHFTKSVVLPQNEFARFLQDKPSDRQDLLARLLDLQVYARVGQRARRAADAASNAAELLRRQLDDYAFATAESRAAAQERVHSLRTLLEIVDAAVPTDVELAEQIRAHESDAERARSLVSRVGRVRVPDDVASLAGDVVQARTEIDVREAAAAESEVTVGELAAEVEAMPAHAALVAARDAHGQLVRVRADLEKESKSFAEADDALRRTLDALAAAEQRVADEQVALDTLRAAHAAHALAATLVAGEPCPVCEHVVETRPRTRKPVSPKAGESSLAKAQTLVEQARTAERKITRSFEQSRARLEALQANDAALRQAVADHPDVDAIATTLEAIDAATKALASARKADTEARRAAQHARAKHRQLEEQLGGLRGEFHAQRDPLIELQPPPVSDDLGRDWLALGAWAQEQLPALEDAAARADAAAADARVQRAQTIDRLRARARAGGVEGDPADLGDLRDAVVETGAAARQTLERITEGIERAAKLREEMTSAVEESDVARMLAQQLRADHFEKWLVGEALDRLVAGASTTLSELTAGNYSLAYDDGGEFAVIDHRNADETRSVRTLSGGETFQASLALALALADQLSEMAASGGAKLDAIFLDEGFGSLDAETLETVAGTIETLGAEGRMVGVVTHVPALAERVPVRFRVAPSARGATVVREEV
jgi:exonuclease SbcC